MVVIGIDIGAGDSYVAYVGKHVVDIVQNEVSKRATPTVVGFTDRERLLGDAALSQIRSNAKNTCRNFKHLLGRKLEAPDVQREHFWSTCPLVECEDGHAGYDVTYKGESRKMSAVEVTAMFLTKLREITETWCEGKVTDCVISVPSSYADVQRQALLDAAKIANISVLRLMNEHTASALAYGIYRSNDFDAEKPLNVVFCSMGQSIFSVSVAAFVKGKVTMLCERNDKVGGREQDECLMRQFAAQFEKKVGCNPLSNKKAAYRLEDAVSKTKKILSANYEAGISCESLMEDEDFSSNVTREVLEQMCEPAMERVRKVLEECKAACGLTTDQIDSVELVGGGSRVPWVKRLCQEAFDKEASTTTNQEESVSRGCALQAAILSPLYKVREFKVEDCVPHAINIGWVGTGQKGTEEDGSVNPADVAGEFKTLTIFPAGAMMNVLKMLTFYRTGPFEIKAEYSDEKLLPDGMPKEIGTFKVELPAQTEVKKVKVRAKLTLHGTFSIEGAQLFEEEEYEEVTKEKRELPPDEPAPADPEAAAPAEEAKTEAAEGDAKEAKPAEKKEPEKKYEWVEVKKMKKRTKRTDLKVVATGTPGLPPATIQKLMDAESSMQAEMAEITDTDAKRNDLESYIFTMRDRIVEGRVYGAFISPADRDTFNTQLDNAENWLYDTYDGTKTMYVEKNNELKVIGDPVAWRVKEDGMRAEWIQAVNGTITNYRTAAENPGEKFGHIAPEKLQSIVTACSELDKWLNDLKGKQEAMQKHEKPVLVCAEMEKKNQELANMSEAILREPKPAPPKKEEEPPKEEKPEEKTEEKTEEAKTEEQPDVD